MCNKKSPYKNKQYTIMESFGFAIEGLYFTFRNERSFRIHIAITTYVLYFTLRYYSLSKGELGLLLLTIMVVLVSEVINTAIEKTVDIMTPDFNPLAKVAKDVAAGGVFLSALGSVAIGILLLWNPSVFSVILKDIISRWYIWIVLGFLTLGFIQLPALQE